MPFFGSTSGIFSSDFDRFVEKTRQLTGQEKKELPGPKKPRRTTSQKDKGDRK